MSKHPLRATPARKEIVRARCRIGWWVKTYISHHKEPTTEVWFFTRRGAERFAGQ